MNSDLDNKVIKHFKLVNGHEVFAFVKKETPKSFIVEGILQIVDRVGDSEFGLVEYFPVSEFDGVVELNKYSIVAHINLLEEAKYEYLQAAHNILIEDDKVENEYEYPDTIH